MTSAANPQWSENWDRPPEQPFRAPLRLPGWETHSYWGYQPELGSFVATLRRNDADRTHRLGLTGIPLRWADCLAVQILELTGCDPLAAVRALGIARPGARLRPDTELATLRRAWRTDLARHGTAGYWHGRVAAADWILTGAPAAPASGWRTTGRPNAEQVDAECVLATGRVYVGGSRPADYYTGLEEGLDLALET